MTSAETDPVEGGPCPECSHAVALRSHALDTRLMPPDEMPRQAEPYTIRYWWQCTARIDHRGEYARPGDTASPADRYRRHGQPEREHQ